MIALLLALTAVPQQTETMKVRPSTEAEAVAEFEATCVAGLYDVMALKRAVAASPRGYRLEGSDTAASWRNWLSPWGTIHFLEGIAASSDMAPKCNLTSFTRAPVDRGALEAALRDMAKRHSARGYVEDRDNARGRFWSWYNRDGRPMAAEVYLDRRTPQQIVLMLKPYAMQK